MKQLQGYTVAGLRGLFAFMVMCGSWWVVLPDAEARQWRADLLAGHATHEAAEGIPVDPASRNLILALQYQGAQRNWFYASAGLPLGGGTGWGASGAGGRIVLAGDRLGLGHGLTLGLDLAGHGFFFRDMEGDIGAGIPAGEAGLGIAMEALPVMGFRRGGTQIDLRSGWVQQGSRFMGAGQSRGGHDTDLRLLAPLGQAVQFSSTVRWLRTHEGDDPDLASESYPYIGAGVWFGRGRYEAWTFVGRWLTDAVGSPQAWGLGGRIAVDRRTELCVAFRGEPDEPLYANAPRRSFSIGVSRRLTGPPVPVRPPMPPIIEDDVVTIRVRASEVASDKAVYVAGEFTDWQPVAMRRVDDLWIVRLSIPPGTYRFAFRAGDDHWFVPAGWPYRLADGMGGESAVLIVP